MIIPLINKVHSIPNQNVILVKITTPSFTLFITPTIKVKILYAVPKINKLRNALIETFVDVLNLMFSFLVFFRFSHAFIFGKSVTAAVKIKHKKIEIISFSNGSTITANAEPAINVNNNTLLNISTLSCPPSYIPSALLV